MLLFVGVLVRTISFGLGYIYFYSSARRVCMHSSLEMRASQGGRAFASSVVHLAILELLIVSYPRISLLVIDPLTYKLMHVSCIYIQLRINYCYMMILPVQKMPSSDIGTILKTRNLYHIVTAKSSRFLNILFFFSEIWFEFEDEKKKKSEKKKTSE